MRTYMSPHGFIRLIHKVVFMYCIIRKDGLQYTCCESMCHYDSKKVPQAAAQRNINTLKYLLLTLKPLYIGYSRAMRTTHFAVECTNRTSLRLFSLGIPDMRRTSTYNLFHSL